MKKRSALLEKTAESIFFVILIAFSIKPVFNFDFWFHIKYGQYILTTHSLPFTDVFSHTAYGQPAIPYEWLFQVLLYLIHLTFGTLGVQALVSLLLLTYLLLFRQILKEIFHISLLPRLFLVALVCLLGFDFWVERPQSGAYVLFMAVLYLILKRVFQKKNVLFFTLPLFLIWTNMHASIILGLYLFAGFAIVGLFHYIKSRKKEDLLFAKEFALYGIANFAITLLPPLSYKVYKLLWLFFEKRTFIMTTIDEWVPLTDLSTRFHLYLVIICLCFIALFLAWRKKSTASLSWFLPFLPLGLFVLSGVRQTAFTMPVILLLAVPFLEKVKFRLPTFFRIGVLFAMIISSVFFLNLYQQVLRLYQRPYPKHAISFIKKNIRGNMFNELFLGGYLLYELGPQYKTFIDGRTDMFLPVIFPEYSKLDLIRDNKDFIRYFNSLVKKYDVSWAIITNRESGVYLRFAQLLPHQDKWHLVYFDDKSEIYIRSDGKNDLTIKNYALDTLAPSTSRLYIGIDRKKAIDDYKKMYATSPSALAAKAAGLLLLKDGRYDEAKDYFQKSVSINPHDPTVNINLAELLLQNKNFFDAIRLYKQALHDDPLDTLASLRLGQLIIASGGDKQEAIEVWKKGIENAVDPTLKAELEKAIAG